MALVANSIETHCHQYPMATLSATTNAFKNTLAAWNDWVPKNYSRWNVS